MTALTDTFTETVDLQGGGELSLLAFPDGSYRLMVNTDGVSLGVPLTFADLCGLRAATGGLVCVGAGR